jgi:predicted metal-dependent phosphoesterase TrpH
MIDLHIHTKDGSDGSLSIDEIFKEAKARGLGLMSITDHDSVDCQERAIELAKEYEIRYITGVELGVLFSHHDYKGGKELSLDVLSYGFDHRNKALNDKLREIREFREVRAEKILENLNIEFEKEGKLPFTDEDLKSIRENVDGSLGRPHIADYLIGKGIVQTMQEAFDRYLEPCDIKKLPFYFEDASKLMKDAGGILVLAHPNISGSPSLRRLTKSLDEQAKIIEHSMLKYLDGIECWHSRLDRESRHFYLDLVKRLGLIATGGSDCHQKPVLMGTLDIPDWVAEQEFFSH